MVQGFAILKSSILEGMSPREYAKQLYGLGLTIDGVLVTACPWHVNYRSAHVSCAEFDTLPDNVLACENTASR